MRILTLLICLLAPATVAWAQDKPAAASSQDNPLSAFNKFAYGHVKNILLRSAEKMPEDNYNFKPTEAVRSYGQILGHLADSQYYSCSVSLGEKNPALKIEQTKSSKADLIAALKDAFAYCDKAYDGMTDASATQMVKLFGGQDTPKLRRADGQQHAQPGTLRQPGHLHADEEHRSSEQRGGVPATTQETNQ
jgi:uncharacterized damage-inducible protein DinB